jgi:hypothetical protein
MDMPKEYGSHKMAWRRLVELGYQAGRLRLGAVAIDVTTIEARKGGRNRGGRRPAAQGEQGARPGGAAGPAPGRGLRTGQHPRCHRPPPADGGLATWG